MRKIKRGGGFGPILGLGGSGTGSFQNFGNTLGSYDNYKLLDVNMLSKYFDYFHIENIDFNPSHTLMSFCIDFLGNENYYFFRLKFEIFKIK